MSSSSFCSCLARLFGGGSPQAKEEDGGVQMERSGAGAGAGGPGRIQYDLRPKGPNIAVSRPTAAGAAGPLIRGAGVALVSIPLEQDATYVELLVRKPGSFCVGVSRDITDARVLADGPLAWGLEVEPAQLLASSTTADVDVEIPHSEGSVPAKAGDVIGIAFSQSSFPMLSFTLNGRPLGGKSIERVRGLVFPAVHLQGAGDGAGEGPCVSFALHESDWAFKPPSSRFQMLMETRDML